MTCSSGMSQANAAAEEALKTSLANILASVDQSKEVASMDSVDAGCRLLTTHLESFDSVTSPFVDAVLKFLSVCSANHESAKISSYGQAVALFYQKCCKTSLSGEVLRKISSLSLSFVELFSNAPTAEQVLKAMLAFHSVEKSSESQQLMEMVAVKMPKLYLSFYMGIEKPVTDCSEAEMMQIAAVIAPLSLLMISRSQEAESLEGPLLWAVKALPVAVTPFVRQRCVGYAASYVLVRGTEHLQNLFVSSEVNFALFFSLSCVEIRMTLETDTDTQQMTSNDHLSSDNLSCLLSALDVALDDLCSGRVQLSSPEQFMVVFDSYKALSLTLLFMLTSDAPRTDWVLVCNAWKLISSYLCESADLPDKSVDFRLLIRAVHKDLTLCENPDTEKNLISSVLPLFFLVTNREVCVDLIFELGLENSFIKFLKDNAASNAHPRVKSIILCCQVLVNLSAKHVLSSLDQWNVDVSNIEDDDIFLHVTRLLLKSSCSSAIMSKSPEKLSEVVERLNKVALDVDGYYEECVETLELLRV